MPCRSPARVAHRAPRRRAAASLLLAVAVFLLPAFSAGQPRATSDAAPAAAAPPPAGPAAAEPLRTRPGDSDNGKAAGAPVDGTGATAGDKAIAAPPNDATPIVLVLPLDSAPYGRAAAAVRDGFLAAAQVEAAKTRVLSHADGDPMPAFVQARALGARVVVGPLVRDDLRALAAATGELPTTLALNQLDETQALPQRVYALTLAIEAEGRQLARVLRAQNAETVAVISADAPLQKRFANAFVDEWIMRGGGPPEMHSFDRAPEPLAQLRRALGRTSKDAVLLAVNGPDIALLKPYVGTTPSYSSSQANDPFDTDNARDLDGLQFVELPWLADPGDPAVDGMPRGAYPNATLERLYALGIDAFRIARAFVDGPPVAMEIDGATGRLTLGNGRVFSREGRLVRFRGGRLEAATPR